MDYPLHQLTQLGRLEIYRVFSHDVTAAILVSQNNETTARLVSQNNPLRQRSRATKEPFFLLEEQHENFVAAVTKWEMLATTNAR